MSSMVMKYPKKGEVLKVTAFDVPEGVEVRWLDTDLYADTQDEHSLLSPLHHQPQ